MFSGIVSAIAKIEKKEKKNSSLFLTIQKPKNWDINPGDSISTNGACLTVKEISEKNYITELMPETLDKTYFDKIDYEYVNLEKSLRLNDLLDGHLVTGHVDVIGKIIEINPCGNSKVIKFSFSKKFSKYIVEKGCISIDGISLTVVDVGDDWFTVSFVDYTLENTTMGRKDVGGLVHLEFDIVAKYLCKLTSHNT
ncbi:MAG: riboflavin synthase [Parcubacteria group bacterium]|nr:riboflavin synthase [Parcubacteria group bacterium]